MKLNMLCQLTFLLLATCTSAMDIQMRVLKENEELALKENEYLISGLDNRAYPYDFDQYGDQSCNDDRSDCEKTEACWNYARECKKTCNRCNFA